MVRSRRRWLRTSAVLTPVMLVLAVVAQLAPATPLPEVTPVACTGNAIACENQLAGNPQSEWDVDGGGDPSIVGFTTDISVNAGSTVQFKINTNASSYSIDIYRMGYYQGNGARKVTSVTPSRARTAVSPAP